MNLPRKPVTLFAIHTLRPAAQTRECGVARKGPRMAKSIVHASDASPLASLLLSYIPAVCAFVAPRQRGASTAIIDRLSHSRALTLT